MKKINVNLLVFGILALINVLLIYSLWKVRTEYATNKFFLSKYAEKNNQLKNGFITLKDLSILQFKSEYVNKRVNLNDNVLKKKCLVLRVHSNDCNECVTGGIKILQKYQIEKELPIVVCADYPNEKSLKSDLPALTYPVIIQNTIETDFNRISDPYIFIYDPVTRTASHTVYLNWQLMDVFEQYTTTLKKSILTL